MDFAKFEAPAKKVRPPLDQQSMCGVGPVAMLTEHELAKKIAICFAEAAQLDDPVSVDQVVVFRHI